MNTQGNGRRTKDLYAEVIRLSKEVRKSFFQITKNLIKIFDDKEFCRIELGLCDDFKIADHLREYLGDCRISFDELRTIHEEYPDESQWTGSLGDLLASAEKIQWEKNKADAKLAPATPRTRKVIKQAEFQVVEDRCKDYEARHKFDKKQLRESKEETKREREAVAEKVEEATKVVEQQAAQIKSAADSRIEELEAENDELRADNNRLRVENEVVKNLLDRQNAAA